MPYDVLLAAPRLSVISAEPDAELDRIAGLITARARVDGPDALAALLDGLCATRGPAAVSGRRTLDLIGHAAAAGQLRLGGWVIDAARAEVTRWFAAQAERRVWSRLGICAIRLLGCHTASTEPARATLGALAGAAGVDVLGARELLHAGHYDPHGFREAWEFLLVAASDLAREARAAGADARPGPHTLELDALPVRVPARGPAPQVIGAADARAILALIQRDAGAPIVGHVGAPVCELALPAADGYCLAEVVLEGAFLRVYPTGADDRGIAYPVRDPGALRALLDRLA
jgi:hypothetical protein